MGCRVGFRVKHSLPDRRADSTVAKKLSLISLYESVFSEIRGGKDGKVTRRKRTSVMVNKYCTDL